MRTEQHYAKVYEAYAAVGESIASNPTLFDAVRTVLRYELELRMDEENISPRLDTPSDIAHAQTAHAKGEMLGLEAASIALLEPEAILARRQQIEQLMKESE